MSQGREGRGRMKGRRESERKREREADKLNTKIQEAYYPTVSV